MMAETWWGMIPEVARQLTVLGWSPEDEQARQYVPAISRHGNAVVAMPPSPNWALPALAAVLTAIDASKGRSLILVAPALVEQFGRAVNSLAEGTKLRVVTATGPARAARLIADGTVDVLIASPGTALTLHTRSALQIDKLTSVCLAWPEDWDADEAVTLLLGELDKDAQRLLFTSAPVKVAELAQRHVRRSLTVHYPAATNETPLAPPRSIKTMATPWSARREALTTILEVVDPPALGVWTVDNAAHIELSSLERELESTAISTRGALEAGIIVCYDLPRPGDLAQLGAGRDVIVLATPGTDSYLRRIASDATPIRRSGIVDRLRDRDAGLRAQIAEIVDSGDFEAATYVIAPLLDRYDPQAVASACLTLWRKQGGSTESISPRPETIDKQTRESTPVGGVENAKVWVGVGRRDEATPGDLVAVLIKEVGVGREAIGRIELRETFTLVEVPKGDAERVAQGLTGITIRRRKLVARVDRGAPERSASDRGAPPRRDGQSGHSRGGPRKEYKRRD